MKNNVGYSDNSNKNSYNLDKIIGLPYGFYEFNDLGKYLILFEKLHILTNRFSSEDISNFSGFIQVEKDNIIVKYKIFITNPEAVNVNMSIIYAYTDNNKIYLLDSELISGDSHKFIDINDFIILDENNRGYHKGDLYIAHNRKENGMYLGPDSPPQPFFRFFAYPHCLFHTGTMASSHTIRRFPYDQIAAEYERAVQNTASNPALFFKGIYSVMDSRGYEDGNFMIDIILNERR